MQNSKWTLYMYTCIYAYLSEGVGEVTWAFGSNGIGISILLAQICRINATHVHSSPVLFRIHNCFQLPELTPIKRYCKPSNPMIGSSI